MQLYLFIIVFISLIAAFIITLLKKIGVIEYMQIKGNNLIHKLANCDFCLSFWIGGIFAFILAAATREPMFLAVPLFSTMITRNLL